MQVRKECDLGTELWTHQNKIDNGAFSLNLPNANKLDIVFVILTCLYLYIVIVQIGYSFTM